PSIRPFPPPPLRPPRPTLFPYTTLFRSPRRAPGGTAALARRPGSRLPVRRGHWPGVVHRRQPPARRADERILQRPQPGGDPGPRSEEHTSELQSRFDLVCRLLLEKKKKN